MYLVYMCRSVVTLAVSSVNFSEVSLFITIKMWVLNENLGAHTCSFSFIYEKETTLLNCILWSQSPRVIKTLKITHPQKFSNLQHAMVENNNYLEIEKNLLKYLSQAIKQLCNITCITLFKKQLLVSYQP